jgi:hypothetical protein
MIYLNHYLRISIQSAEADKSLGTENDDRYDDLVEFNILASIIILLYKWALRSLSLLLKNH